MSLSHKPAEENPWDVFEGIFTVDSILEDAIIEMLDKGAVIALPYGVEGFATSQTLGKTRRNSGSIGRNFRSRL